MKIMAWWSARTEDVCLSLGPREAQRLADWFMADVAMKLPNRPPVVVQIEAQLRAALQMMPDQVRAKL